MQNEIKIAFLKDHPQHIAQLATLWQQTIGQHWVPHITTAQAEEKFKQHLNHTKLPIAFVALHNDKPVGMACLRLTEGILPGVKPWLGGLMVDPNYQHQKIGESLITTVKNQAFNMGYKKIHLLTFDSTLPIWYQRLGWEIVNHDEIFDHTVTIMAYTLS